MKFTRMTETDLLNKQLSDDFLTSMRSLAAGVSLVTVSDKDGKPHGMAVTSATSLSMEPPSMMVAVNKSASIYPVIKDVGFFSLNLLEASQGDMLEAFSRSDMRDKRFQENQWEAGYAGLPALKGALSTHFCKVAEAHDFGTHTVFFGTVEDLVIAENAKKNPDPIIWLNGRRMCVAAI